jgi:iron complex outermembrane receptor protein
MKTTFQLSTLSAAVAATLISGYVTAQESIREEVIVTATRRAESIQDIPINITAVSGNMIERERLTNMSDIARRVPGLVVVDQGPRSGNIIAARGLNVDSIAAQDGQNDGGGTIATYLGEIPVFLDMNLNDMDRVEVLIGPQGTLYGAGTLGGAIRYIPNRPQTDETTVDLRGDIYDLSESADLGYEGGVTINIPIVEDKLAVRASIDYADDPGFIDYNFLVREAGVSKPQPDFDNPADVAANLTSEEDANTHEMVSSRVALRYTGDKLDANLTYYFQESDIGARQINHSGAFGTGEYESAHRYLEPSTRKSELIALELVADLGFAELTSATGFSEYTQDGQRDQTDLLLTFEYGYELFPAFAAFTREDAKEETFTQELRLVSTSDGMVNWIVGAFYNEYDSNTLSQEFTPGFDQFAVDEFGGVALRPDSLEYYESYEEETTEFAVFGELGFQFTDAWQVTVGARYFEYETDAVSGLALPLFDTVFDGAPADSINIGSQANSVDDDDVIYKFNTSYDISDDIMTYATISEGYRLGGLNSVPPCPTPVNPNVQNVCALPDEVLIKSDTTVNYEIGVHSEIGDSIVLNAAVYFIEWEDVQVADVTANGDIPITTNGGSAESKGIELAGQFYITPDFSIMGSYAYTNAELTENAPGIVGGVDGEDGDRLPGSPESTIYLAANYSMPLDTGASVDFDWSMVAQSDVYTKPGNRNNGEELDGFALHNVSATWVQENCTVSLYADNVFDKYAVTGVRSDTSNIRAVEGVDLRRYYQNVVRPRQVGLRFTYHFDM